MKLTDFGSVFPCGIRVGKNRTLTWSGRSRPRPIGTAAAGWCTPASPSAGPALPTGPGTRRSAVPRRDGTHVHATVSPAPTQIDCATFAGFIYRPGHRCDAKGTSSDY